MTEEAQNQMKKEETKARAKGDWQAVIDLKIAQVEGRSLKKRGWIVLRKSWLTSSIHYRMTMEERFVFSMLLVLADEHGPVPGLISDNDCKSMPDQHIAHLCFAPLEVLESCLEKCKEDTSMYENGHGIFVIHFDEYQFTEYDRQKKYRQQWREKDRVSTDPDKYTKGRYGHLVVR